MDKTDFINIHVCSILNSSMPPISIRLNLNDIESLRIEREDNGTVSYAIYLEDGRVFDTNESDGLRIIEKLRERTAEQYKG